MTAWARAGSSYVCECRPGYEAAVDLSGGCSYATPWGTMERGAEAVLTVVERATGIAVAKRLRVAGATSPGDVEQVARRIADARIREASAKEEDLAGKGWHLDRRSGTLTVAPRGSRAAVERPVALGRLGGAPNGAPCFALAAADGGYSASWMPAEGEGAVESGAWPTPSEALARLASRLVEEGMPASGDAEGDDLARYERLYAGDVETYKRTNLDELIRACRASARHGAGERNGGGAR
ncbi:MAG: hypothetical protein ACLRKT_14150 [Eggerthella lenta]